jgi:hypothetical protein
MACAVSWWQHLSWSQAVLALLLASLPVFAAVIYATRPRRRLPSRLV